MREPKANDLIDFITWVQPELDPAAAVQMLMVEDIWDHVAEQWRHHREFCRSLLEYHLICQEVSR